MKKRIFSRLMAAFIAVTLLSTTALAAPISLSSDLDEKGNLKYSDEAKSEEGVYEYYVAEEKLVLDKTLEISGDKKVSIDLNGNTLALNENLIIDKETSTASVPEGEKLKMGPVIVVMDSDDVTITDSSAIKVDENGEAVLDEKGDVQYVVGQGTGTITGGTGMDLGGGQNWGGGVVVANTNFTMKGGNISHNYASEHGGGILVGVSANVNLYGTTISDNYSRNHGGGMVVCNFYDHSDVNVTMDHVRIEGNTAAYGHGGGCRFWTNDTTDGKGKVTVTIKDSVITGNTNIPAWGSGAGIYHGLGENSKLAIEYTLENSSVCKNFTAGKEDNISYTDGEGNIVPGNPAGAPHHSWGEVIADTPATCHSTGIGHRLCKSGCREDNITISMDPTNHDGGTEVRSAVPAAPGVPGYTGDTYCTGCGELIQRGEVIPALPMPIDFGEDLGGGADTGTTIDDEATPLAGLFTRADAIGYLWEQSGSPEAELSTFADVPEDHYWAVAIGWAEDNGIALPDEEGNFRPDDLVLRTSDEPEGELQEFLNRYAVFAGVELEPDALFFVLDGAADDVIMGEDAQVIFDAFFAKLEKTLAEQEKAA